MEEKEDNKSSNIRQDISSTSIHPISVEGVELEDEDDPFASLGKIDRSSSRLYLSKIQTLTTCPMKAWWRHFNWIKKDEDPEYFVYGRQMHKLNETYLKTQDVGEAVIETFKDEKIEEERRDDLLIKLSLLKEKYEEEGIRNIEYIEAPILLPLNGEKFKSWVTKPDFIAEFKDGLWNCELKTTSRYGASTARYYHNSMQTLSYFYSIKKSRKDIKGTKMFIIVKTKEPRVMKEDIILTPEDERKAELFLTSSHAFAEMIWQRGMFYRFLVNCQPAMGGECPYLEVCFNFHNIKYQKEVLNYMFKVEDPDEHLGL